MIDTILFDFDGTLMDTNQLILNSWQHTFRTLENREESEERIIATFGETLERTIRNFFPDVPLEESVPVYREYHRERFLDEIALFPGVIDMLEAVKAAGFKTALVTSRLYATTMAALDKFDMHKYFDVVVTPRDTDKHKPDPEPALVALEALGVDGAKAVFVGDTKFDMGCGVNAGAKSIMVEWSVAFDEEDNEFRIDARLDKPENLLAVIEGLGH